MPEATNSADPVFNSINTGKNVVYPYLENGVTKYYGITNDFARRATEHLYTRGWVLQKIPGLDQLNRFDARAVEQVLIENAGLPNLYNKINSIAMTNNIDAESIYRGTYIVQQIGLLPK